MPDLKKLCILLTAVLLLSGFTAWAEDGANLEVIRMDGVSVVMFTPEETLERVSHEAIMAKSAGADFTTPGLLTEIAEEAFAGIAAERVEITENVAIIRARAFADCKGLRQIAIPANVVTIEDSALAGCTNVTVYGQTGTEAERFAKAAGFAFVDLGTGTVPPPRPPEPPVTLPLVPRK